MPIILATWEAKIRRITVQGQPQAKNLQDPISAEKKCAWLYMLLKPPMVESLK
jgi:hypothetical protein